MITQCGFCSPSTAGTHEANCPNQPAGVAEAMALQQWSWRQTWCEHCYCRTDHSVVAGRVGPHRQCCKCFNVMAEAFIPTPSSTSATQADSFDSRMVWNGSRWVPRTEKNASLREEPNG